MKPIEGWDLINEAGEFKTLPPSIQGLKITKIVNNAEKEYFEVYFDITKGEYANYFKTLESNGVKDPSKTIRSYKNAALPFFKGFITAITKSNPGFEWDWNEQKLVGKNVIGVFGEEEFINDAGEVKTTVRIQEFRSLDAYQKGEIKIPAVKKVTDKDWEDWRAKHPVSGDSAPESKPEPSVTKIDPADLPF